MALLSVSPGNFPNTRQERHTKERYSLLCTNYYYVPENSKLIGKLEPFAQECSEYDGGHEQALPEGNTFDHNRLLSEKIHVDVKWNLLLGRTDTGPNSVVLLPQ